MPMRSSVLSRLKNGKVIGVVDEDPSEEPHRQDAVEPLRRASFWVPARLKNVTPRQFERADLHILGRQSRKDPLRSIHPVPAKGTFWDSGSARYSGVL